MAAEVFMSYSHKDEGLRDELEVHLAMLKRQGLISLWHDRRIDSGDYVHGEIMDAMKRANLILFLVSPDFLASDYCYDVEVQTAVERHKSGAVKVIPIILRPCEWKQVDLFKNLLGAPTDNRAVSKWPDRDEAFLDITTRIRTVIEKMRGPTTHSSQTISVAQKQTYPNHDEALPRSSNLTVKKDFSDHDRDNFLDEAYAYIRRFFEGSLLELCQRNPEFSHKVKDLDNTSFSASIYKNGNLTSVCTVFMANTMGKGISYITKETSERNSYNEQLSVSDDGQKLFLASSGMMSYLQRDEDRKLTFEGGAELYWDKFIQPLKGSNW